MARKATKKTAKKKAAKRVGRPSSFKEEYIDLAFNYALLGAIDEEMIKFFGVAESTFNLWKKKHPEFSEALKRGKDQADAKVAQSLYHRAVGYSHKDTKFATHEGKITDKEEFIRHYPPETAACIFWLKNRQRDKFRQSPELVINNNTDSPKEMDLSKDALAQLEKIQAIKAKVGEPSYKDEGKDDDIEQ